MALHHSSHHQPDAERFGRWADTYDRHWLQPLLFQPVHEAALQLAAQQVPTPAAVLDIGCGTGRLLRSAQARFPAARLVGVDAAPEMVAAAQRTISAGTRIEFETAIAEKLPFPEAQFDLVFSTLTFHHWSDQPAGAREVARILRPGGRWILVDFVASGVMKTVRRVLRMRQFPDRETLASILRSSGLEIKAESRVPRRAGQLPVLALGLPPA